MIIIIIMITVEIKNSLELSNDFDSIMRSVVNILRPRFLDTSGEPELVGLGALD